MDPHLPQEVIDLIIGYTEDRATLASLRLVSQSCRSQASRLYFRQLFVMLSSKSTANIKHLSESPYSNYVEELYWADIELQYQLNDDLEAFQEAFKERLAGLSSEAVLEWHGEYRALHSDQESLYYPLYVGEDKEKFNVASFVNLKKVSVINRCEDGAEQYPTALEAPELLHHPARWSTTRQCRPQRGNVYPRIVRSLAALNRLTHLSVKTEDSKWERLFMSPHRTSDGTEPVSLLKNVKHLDVDLCLSGAHPHDNIPISRCRISRLGNATNLESLTWKAHFHAMDEAGDLGRPLAEPQTIEWVPPPFTLRSEQYPKLRYLELHGFCVSNNRLLGCLTTLQSSLHSIILRHCVFKPSLLGIFMQIRHDGVVPPVAIFEHSRDHARQPDPRKPSIFNDFSITQYLVGSGMKGTLCLHSWDAQVEAYMNCTLRGEREAKRAESEDLRRERKLQKLLSQRDSLPSHS